MRKTFDNWLNIIAVESGAEFREECEFLDFEEQEDGVVITLQSKGEKPEKIKARYAVDATGVGSLPMRRKLRPRDFGEKASGGCMNFYIDGEADLDPEALYQFWNLDFSDVMFAWIYTKTLDDGKDYWCVGTGGNSGDFHKRQDLFYSYVKEKFKIHGKIIDTEVIETSIDMKSSDRVWLGQGRIIMVGDAAGLLDGVRGVGQDAAALSGRLAARAIIESDRKGTNVLDEYAELTKVITTQTRKNQEREIDQFKNNKELKKYLLKNFASTGIKMGIQSLLNKFRPVEKMRLLPP